MTIEEFDAALTAATLAYCDAVRTAHKIMSDRCEALAASAGEVKLPQSSVVACFSKMERLLDELAKEIS